MGDIAIRSRLPGLRRDLRAETHQCFLLLACLPAKGLPDPSGHGDAAGVRADLPNLWRDLRAETHQCYLLLARLPAKGLPHPSGHRDAPASERTCLICGVTFVPKRSGSTYCSRAYWQRAYLSRRATVAPNSAVRPPPARTITCSRSIQVAETACRLCFVRLTGSNAGERQRPGN
jgi:hypothetical protein